LVGSDPVVAVTDSKAFGPLLAIAATATDGKTTKALGPLGGALADILATFG